MSFGPDRRQARGWLIPARLALVIGLLGLCSPSSAEEGGIVEVEADGLSMEDARRNAVRAALQESVEQLVVVDREMDQGEMVRDRILSTVNGFVRNFELVEVLRRQPDLLIRARVQIATSDIRNYVDYLVPSRESGFDGESVFGELERRRMQAESLRSIFHHLLRGIPLRRFLVDVQELSPADPQRTSFYHRLPPAQDAVDVIFEGGMDPDVGQSLHAFLGSIEGAVEWRCNTPGRPVTLDWHSGSLSPAWHQCADQPESFRERFTSCSTDDGQDSLRCTSVDPELADGEPLARPLHQFSSSRNRGYFIYSFLDSQGRSTHEQRKCYLLAVDPDRVPAAEAALFRGVAYPMKGDDPHLWQVTSTPFALAAHHVLSDERRVPYFARIPVSRVDLPRTESLRIGLALRRSDGLFVASMADEGKPFDTLCKEFLSGAEH